MSRKRNRSVSIRPLLDVVVTTAGRLDLLELCMASLYRNSKKVPISITIVDQDIPVDDKKLHAELFECQESSVVSFQVVRMTPNLGFPSAANMGARKGSSPIITFISDDVELQDDALENILSSFVDSTVGVVGTRLLFPKGQSSPSRPAGKIQHVGLALNLRGVPVHPLNGWSPENPKTQLSRDAWAVTGACFSIRRELFNKAGGFDPIYGRGTFEDCDLCMKVRQMGKRIYLNAKAQGYHYTGATVEKRREGFPLQQNLQIFQTRWGQTGLMTWDEFTYYNV